MNEKLLLMSTRLKMPQPRKNYIVRQELFSKLEMMNDYSVILIRGGAGTGKTTLMSSFANEKSISNLKWISLDERCNNVFQFWSYFIEAVGEYLGDNKQDFISLYDSNFQKSNLEQLLTVLINSLDMNVDIFIVLDDFYYITDNFLLNTIEFFLKNSSDNIHIILLTRSEPLLYLGNLNMEGKLLIIDERDLKVSTEFGIRFLRDTLKLKLKSEILDYMNVISEGWIGGLQLIAAASGGKEENEIMRLNLEKGLVGDYLTKEIFEVLSKEEREFLIITSMSTYFNEDICNSLLEKTDFKKVVEALLRKNILIISIDEERQIYRYHNILREYLKGRFMSFNKETQIQLRLKLAEVLKKIGDYNQCIDQLLLAEDYSSAIKLILELPQNVALSSNVDRIPEEYVIKNTDFAYQSFFYHYTNMEFDKCRILYDGLKAIIGNDSTFTAFKFSNVIIDDTFRLNEIDVMSLSEIEKLPLKETTKAYIFIGSSTLLYSQSNYKDALEFINKAMSYPASHNNFYSVFFSLSIKAQILEDMGQLNESLALYKAMYKIIEENKSPSMLAASFYIGFIGVYLKRMDLTSAGSCLKNAEKYMGKSVHSLYRGFKYNLAEYKFNIGETEDAIKLTEEVMKMEVYDNPIYLAPLIKYVFQLNKYSGELVQRYKDCFDKLPEKYKSLESKLVYAYILFYEEKTQVALEL